MIRLIGLVIIIRWPRICIWHLVCLVI